MFRSITNNTAKNLSAGGTISGDVTITGDLSVTGNSSVTINETIQGTSTIDVDSTEALLVRKNGDGGDIFTVDTTNEDVAIGGSLAVSGDTANGSYLGHINNTGSQSEDNGLHIQIASSGSGAHGLKVQTGGSANAFIVSGDGKVGLGYSSGSMTEIFNVNGNAAFAGTLSAVTTTNSDVTVANFQSAIDANGEHSIIRVGHSSKAAYMGLLLNSSDTSYFGIDDNPDDGNGIYVDESANVYIGHK